MKHTIIRSMFTVTLTTAAGCGHSATAQAADKGCSNSMLTGTFAHTNTGFFTAAAAPLQQAHTGVGVQTFDGNDGLHVGKR